MKGARGVQNQGRLHNRDESSAQRAIKGNQMRQRIAIFITCIGLTVLSASCTYTAKLDPTTLRAPITGQRILPLKVGVFIAPEVASHVDKTDVRTGVWSQHVTVDS